MWLFTRHGFYSVVCARKTPDMDSPVDKNRMMVRARCREDLERLQAFVASKPWRFGKEMVGAPIHEGTGTDYPFRIFVGRAAWTSVAETLASDIDYDNFKAQLHEDTYHDACLRVWGIMRDALELRGNQS